MHSKLASYSQTRILFPDATSRRHDLLLEAVRYLVPELLLKHFVVPLLVQLHQPFANDCMLIVVLYLLGNE
jgi:hypothetical protein